MYIVSYNTLIVLKNEECTSFPQVKKKKKDKKVVVQFLWAKTTFLCDLDR